MIAEKKQSILILGSSSSIAIYIIDKLLKKGYQNITCISRSYNKNIFSKSINYKIHNELNNLKDIEKEIFNANIIINLIGEYRNISRMELINIRYLECLFEKIISNKNNQRLIHISSVSCYGHNTNYQNSKININEKKLDNPNSSYGLTKSIGDKIIQKLKYVENKSFTIIRPTIIYDLRNSSKLIVKLIKVSRLNSIFSLFDDNNYLNIIDIRDVANIIFEVIKKFKKSKNEIFIASNDYYKKDFFNEIDCFFKIKKIKFKTPKIIFNFVLKFIKFIRLEVLINNFLLLFFSNRFYCNKKIKNKLNYHPKYKIRNNKELKEFIKRIKL